MTLVDGDEGVRDRGQVPGRDVVPRAGPRHLPERRAVAPRLHGVHARAASSRSRGRSRSSGSASSRRPLVGQHDLGRLVATSNAPIVFILGPAIALFFTLVSLYYVGERIRAPLRHRRGRSCERRHATRRRRPQSATPRPTADASLLEVRDLRTTFRTPRGPLVAVDGVSLTLDARRDARGRRRVGLGQDGAVAVDHGAAAGRGRRRSTGSVLFDGMELVGRQRAPRSGRSGGRASRWSSRTR